MQRLLFIFMLTLFYFTTGQATESKSTVYMKCSRELPSKKIQSIIIATENISESKCKILGNKKSSQFESVGWKCVGLSNQPQYSCEEQKAANFVVYNNLKLDHLTFTNLEKHRSIIAYIDPDSNQLCHEDKAEIMSAGVKDAVCHKRATSK